MEEKRCKGYVIGSDLKEDGNKIWKVKVTDKESELDGKKLIVASVHGGVELSNALNVEFLVGSVGPEKRSLRAVDVCIAQ
jgi:hypothetical protein